MENRGGGRGMGPKLQALRVEFNKVGVQQAEQRTETRLEQLNGAPVVFGL